MRKAVFNCDTCDFEKTDEFFTENSFRDSELSLVFTRMNDSDFKLERPSRQLCPKCQVEARKELTEFLRQSKYFY